MQDARFFVHSILIAGISFLCSCSSRTDCNTPCAPVCNAPELCCSVRDDAPCLQDRIEGLQESKRLCMLENRFDEITAINVEGCIQGYTPAHLEDNSWIVSGELLYTKASEDGLEFVAQVENLGDLHLMDFTERLVSPHFDWSFGCRFGLGNSYCQHEDWNLTLNWTYIHNSARASAKASPGVILLPLWGGEDLDNILTGFNKSSIIGDLANKANARWQLNLNVLDLELGRDFFISKAITAHPFICVRGVDVDQHYRLNYEALIVPAITSSAPSLPLIATNTAVKSKGNFLGVGPRIGSDLLFHINCDWGITCKVAGSLFYGKFDVNQKYQGSTAISVSGVPPVTVTPTSIKYRDNRWRIESEIEAAIGVQWESFLRCNKYHVAVALSYEFSEWFHMNRFVHTSVFATTTAVTPTFFDPTEITFDKEYGDLGLQGASFKIRFDF